MESVDASIEATKMPIVVACPTFAQTTFCTCSRSSPNGIRLNLNEHKQFSNPHCATFHQHRSLQRVGVRSTAISGMDFGCVSNRQAKVGLVHTCFHDLTHSNFVVGSKLELTIGGNERIFLTSPGKQATRKTSFRLYWISTVPTAGWCRRAHTAPSRLIGNYTADLHGSRSSPSRVFLHRVVMAIPGT